MKNVLILTFGVFFLFSGYSLVFAERRTSPANPQINQHRGVNVNTQTSLNTPAVSTGMGTGNSALQKPSLGAPNIDTMRQKSQALHDSRVERRAQATENIRSQITAPSFASTQQISNPALQKPSLGAPDMEAARVRMQALHDSRMERRLQAIERMHSQIETSSVSTNPQEEPKPGYQRPEMKSPDMEAARERMQVLHDSRVERRLQATEKKADSGEEPKEEN